MFEFTLNLSNMKSTKGLFMILVLLGTLFSANGQTSTKNNKLLGVITKADLLSGTYRDWFAPQFNAYKVDTTIATKLLEPIKEFEIVVFLGTWCGDSRKEVPQFYKLLEHLNYPMQKLKVVAVDNEKENYKKSPSGEEKGLNIHRVPTFIFYKNGKEVNRIVEHPKISFEADMHQIISSNSYEPNYSNSALLLGILQDKGINYIKNSDELINQIAPNVKNEREFNGLGYVFLNGKEYDNAIAIFTLNNKLFPTSLNTFDSLAEAYELAGNIPLALKNYKLALGVIEKNPMFIRLKEKINLLEKEE